MRLSDFFVMAAVLALAACRGSADRLPPLDVSEVKCNTHRAGAGAPACVHALEHFFLGRTIRIVQVVAADDGTEETERLFVVHTRTDARWSPADDLIVAPVDRAINDEHLIVFTLRSKTKNQAYLVRPVPADAR